MWRLVVRMDGFQTDLRNLGWMDPRVSLFYLTGGVLMLIVAIALSLFLLAPMLDFWRAKNAWLPTWPAKEGRSMIM